MGKTEDKRSRAAAEHFRMFQEPSSSSGLEESSSSSSESGLVS